MYGYPADKEFIWLCGANLNHAFLEGVDLSPSERGGIEEALAYLIEANLSQANSRERISMKLI
jgi:uncharacterized protein YjbI with pentapeptide repeats